MSTATELLRRALETPNTEWFEAEWSAIKKEIKTYLSTPSDDAEEPYAWAWDEIMSDGLEPVADMDKPIDNEYRTNIRPLFLHPPKPAEPEAEYDLSQVIPLTHRKAKGIINDKSYNVTGFVLTECVAENKCIVDMSAVRWLTGKEFFEMMHPPVVSLTAESKAEPVKWNDITDKELRELHEEDQFGLFCDADEFIDISRAVITKFKYHNTPTKTAPMKHMTETEIIKQANLNEFNVFDTTVFAIGVRYAERYHAILRECCHEQTY